MRVYPSDPEFVLRGHKSIKKGSSCNLGALSLGTHTGTHIDAPRHIIEGAGPVDGIAIDKLICRALVAGIDDLKSIGFLNGTGLKRAKAILLKR
jgi:arylformamidase